MEFKINHLTLVEPSHQQPFFEEAVKNKIARFRQLLRDYPKNLLLEVFVKKEAGYLYVVTASLALRGKFLYAEEKGIRAAQVAENALDKLKGLMKKQIATERKEYLFHWKYKTHARAENARGLLVQLARKEDPASFVATLKEVMPETGRFIRKEIDRLISRLINPGQQTVEPFVDEVYLDLFKHFKQHPDDPEKMIIKFFTVAGRKIQSLRQLDSKAIGRYLQKQGSFPNELIDPGKDLKKGFIHPLIENSETGETYFSPQEFNLQEVLTDAGAQEEIIIGAEADDDNLFILGIQSEFPLDHQSVFDLYYLHRFRIDEIARIKNMKESEVDRWLREIRSMVLLTIKNEVGQHSLSVPGQL
jgi:hypothetical protein